MSETLPNLSIDVGGTKVRVTEYQPDLVPRAEHTLATADIFQGIGQADLDRLFARSGELTGGATVDRCGLAINCLVANNKVIYSRLLGGGEGLDLESSANRAIKFNRFRAVNDVTAMANAEAALGVGRSCQNFLLVNLGTGLRVAYCEDGQVVVGGKGAAGEVGQVSVWANELMAPVKWEDLISGQGVSNLAMHLTGEKLTAQQVFELRNKSVIASFIRYLAKFLEQMSYTYNPKGIVFGGSLTLSADQWLESVKDLYFNGQHKFLLADDITVSEIENPASIGAVLFD